LSRLWKRKRLRQELRFYSGAIEKDHPPDANADLRQCKHSSDCSYDGKHFRIHAIAGRRFEKEDHGREDAECAKHHQENGKHDGGNTRPVFELQQTNRGNDSPDSRQRVEKWKNDPHRREEHGRESRVVCGWSGHNHGERHKRGQHQQERRANELQNCDYGDPGRTVLFRHKVLLKAFKIGNDCTPNACEISDTVIAKSRDQKGKMLIVDEYWFRRSVSFRECCLGERRQLIQLRRMSYSPESASGE